MAALVDQVLVSDGFSPADTSAAFGPVDGTIGELTLRQLEACFRGSQLRLRARSLGLERTWVDGKQQLALSDQGAVDEMHLVDDAGDARPQLDIPPLPADR